MQLHQLQAFLTLAQDLNFRRAATRLCLSQPALSAQIAELERDLGVRLFDRDRSGTRLTADGLALLPSARSAVAAVAEVEQAARRSPGYRRRFEVGLMDYGIGPMTWPLLRAFHEARPDLHLDVVRVGFEDALPWLRAGLVDVLLAIGPFGEEDGEVTTVGWLPVSAILPTWHPRAEEAQIEAGWLAEHVSVAPPAGMGRTWVDFWTMQDLGGPPLDRMRLLDPGIHVEQLLEVITRGALGPWPAGVPAMPGVSIVELDNGRRAPLQVLLPSRAHPDARQFQRMAIALAARQEAPDQQN